MRSSSAMSLRFALVRHSPSCPAPRTSRPGRIASLALLNSGNGGETLSARMTPKIRHDSPQGRPVLPEWLKNSSRALDHDRYQVIDVEEQYPADEPVVEY